MAAPVFVFKGELLHQAAIYDQRDLLKSLLDAKVHGEANSLDPRGLTPLHTAALHDSVGCLVELLERKGDVDIQSAPEDNCSTALHHAARNGHLRCLKVLIDAGARVDIKNKDGKTAMQIAFEMGEFECGNYLRTMEAIRKAAREEEISQELYRCCATGDLPRAKELLGEASTTTINKLYQGGSTLLYKACQGGHLEVVKHLLNSGADGSPNTITGIAPLYAATLSGNDELVRLMVQKFPHAINIPSKMDGSTALHVAAGEGSEEIIKSILQVPRDGEELAPCNKIDMGVRTSTHMTALHLAAQGGFVKVLEQLLDCSHKCAGPCEANLTVSVNATDIMGQTALQGAVTVGYRDVVQLLITHGADVNLCQSNAESFQGESDSAAHATSGVNPATGRCSPLEIACSQGDLEMVKLLLNNGAEDADHKNLNSAIVADSTEVIAILLQQGAQVDQEHKLYPSRTSNSPEELWRMSAAPISLLWNDMKLTKLEQQWILAAASRINPFDGDFAGLHPSLKTVTRVDISSNRLLKLPIVLFQMAALKTLNVSDNAITCLPCLWLGGKKEKKMKVSTLKVGKKAYSSCENISENLVFSEESEQDFSYVESGWNCPHLEDIELHHNSLTHLPTCLFELPVLKYLNVSYNDIQTLPFEMWTSPALKSLDLKGNFLRNLPVMKPRRARAGTGTGTAKTSSLPRAKVLSLSKDNLPGDLSHASPSLESSSPKQSAEVDGVKDPHLKMFHHGQLWGTRPGDEIEDSDSEEEDIDPSKGASLQKLDLSSNQIVKIRPGLSCLATNLVTLILSNNNISDVPSLALFPTSLGTLDLSHNNLTRFHPITENFFHGNAAESRCYSVVEGQKPSVRRRISAENGLHAGRVRLCRHAKHRALPNLKRLDLNNNKLEEIYFTLPRTRPASVASVSDPTPANSKGPSVLFPILQSLTLSNNELWSLPKDVGVLSKLGSLHVSNTRITRLPPEVGLLSELWDLQFQGLQLQDIEPSVLERKKTKDIVGYLRSVLERSEPHPSMKLMFVGVANIGKTTLLSQLRQEGTGSYQNSPPVGWTERKYKKKRTGSITGRTKKAEMNISTVGVDVCDWIYPNKRDFAFGRADNRPSIKFSTWDFGGQREYYATHQCFLSHRSLYIAMWKVTDGEQGVNQIEPWLLNIQARAPDSTVIIVGTHYDLLEDKDRRSEYLTNLRSMISDNYIAVEYGGRILNTRERGLPKVRAMIEVSCKTGYHIRELRQLIYNTSFDIKEKGSRLPLLKTPIPASYIAVENAVGVIRDRCYRDDQSPVLKSEQFSAAVEAELSRQNFHLRGPEELQQATRFLHDNGVLLHYDDPLLRDLYFLDPQWLCDMLAHVVTIREVNPHINNGVMKRSDLSQIFRSERFPANLMSQYINLLSKFEVALPWSPEFLLVPSLLPDSQQETNQPVAAGVSAAVAQAMNVTAYNQAKVLRRQYVMSYVPSGFWPRLITRVIPDERIRDTVKSCCQLSPDGPVQEGDRDKLTSVAQPEWSCWKTGIELSCFGVKLLRICELEGRPFYGAPDDMANPLHYRREVHDTTRYSTIEVLTPCVRIRMEKFEQRKKVTSRRTSQRRVGEDHREGSKVIGFKVKSVLDSNIQSSARLVAIAVEHMDTLITDWFPGLDAITVHGNRLVTRIIPCPKCIMTVYRIDRAENEKERDDVAVDVPLTLSSGQDSGINLSATDGSSTSASPWPSPVHVSRRPETNGEVDSPSQSVGSSDMQQGQSHGSPQFPFRDRFHSEPERFTFGYVSTERETEEESSSCFDYTSDQSTDSHGSESSQSFSPEMGGRRRKQSGKGRRELRRSDSEESDVSDMNSKTKKSNETNQEEPNEGGSTDSAESFQRGSGKYGSFRKRPTENDAIIYSFEFEECVLAAYNTEPVECTVHGQLDIKELAPDAMFEDIAPNMNIQASDLTRGKFLGKGTFGSVFRGELRQESGNSITIAMKMPLNNEVGDDAPAEEKQMAAAAMRALKENPTVTLNDAYRTVRQEMSILLPLKHHNIVSLLGYCLNPFSMILEFAPQGALDGILANYKRAGVRLNAYVMQKCIVQCASAMKYLHRHHIIYRDLKSENILVWVFPAPTSAAQSHHQVVIKLADYGISRSAALAGMKGLGGTPGFMAPEIEKYVGKELYTDKVDSFSFGMYIYELITLHQPFNDLNPAQVKQLIVEGHRPPLTAKDKKAPVFVLDLMAWCWQQEAEKRPPSYHIYQLSSATEFPRLSDVLTFDKQLGLNCAVTAGSRVSQSRGADDRASVGSEVWLCRSELNAGIGRGKINVLSYSRGRCYHKKEFFVGKSCIRVACSVGSSVWLGTESGTLHVFCAMTCKQLCQGSIRSNRYILNMIHVPRANWVLVALADGSVLAYDDNISNHYHHSYQSEQTPVLELLPRRVHTGDGIPIHCMAALLLKKRKGNEPPPNTEADSSEDSDDRNSPRDEYVCEVWCGKEKGRITILDGEEMQKICTKSAEDSEPDSSSQREHSVSHLETCQTTSSTISGDDPVGRSVWVALFPGTRVYRWDALDKKIVRSVDCSQYPPRFEGSKPKVPLRRGADPYPLSPSRAQVNSLLAVDKELYIGTSYGCILVCNNISLMVYTVIRCHDESVKHLLPLVTTPVVPSHSGGEQTRALVLSCGRGYRSLGASLYGHTSYPSRRSGKTTLKGESVVLVWLADVWES